MKSWLGLALALAHLFLIGCAPMPPLPPADAAIQHCPVCRDRRDFTCLTVPTSPGTPHFSHAGRTYWFCSQSCYREFQESPERFSPAKP